MSWPTMYVSPEVGDRVVCTVCPDADGSMATGEVVEVVRQSFADSLARVAWDGAPEDNDLYSTAVLDRELDLVGSGATSGQKGGPDGVE